MAKKNFKVDILSKSSIEQLKKELIKYQGELQAKTWELCQRLAEQGVDIAKARINESPLGKYITLKTEISAEDAGCRAILIATGEVKESEKYSPFSTLLAVEFGAGVHYNPTPNPISKDFGLGVGTFPGQIHAFDPDGWYFWDEDAQEWRHSYGVRATMPMYETSIRLHELIVKTAKDVFK